MLMLASMEGRRDLGCRIAADAQQRLNI